MEIPIQISSLPSSELTLRNSVVISPKIFPDATYLFITNGYNSWKYSVIHDVDIAPEKLGLSKIYRDIIGKEGTVVRISPFVIEPLELFAATRIIINLSFREKPERKEPPYDTKIILESLLSQSPLNMLISEKQKVVIHPVNHKYKILMGHVMNIYGKGRENSILSLQYGIITEASQIQFLALDDSSLRLMGEHICPENARPLINPDWDFNSIGIGGLSTEFSDIFRRAFSSRVFPPDMIEKMGLKHVKGILLFGPPGTGKTLMARQIGKMLNTHPPKLVSGPEILNKYVGESEAAVRRLFEDAEKEQKVKGNKSSLHMIIFDEIDAICKQRGTVSGGTGVNDSVVNQLLSKLDGLEQLNNVLVIGMTNRKDMIDEALLRPGRLEVHMDINLPNEEGRVEILNIHTSKMYQNKLISEEVDIKELAKITKNFSGAELEGLVRTAQSTAMNRQIDFRDTVRLKPDAMKNLIVMNSDFVYALEKDVKPAFGYRKEDLESYFIQGMIPWSEGFYKCQTDIEGLVNLIRHTKDTPLASILIHGMDSTGKTALAVWQALRSDFPFIRIISPENMIGFTESSKCQAIKKVFDDAYKSELSCIVVDDLERLIDFVPVGPRFSNSVLQTLLILLKKFPPRKHKLLIIGTTSDFDNMQMLGFMKVFTKLQSLPPVRTIDELCYIIKECEIPEQVIENVKKVASEKGIGLTIEIRVGIKKLLAFIDEAKHIPDVFANNILELVREESLSNSIY